jgi:hypothetical protein
MATAKETMQLVAARTGLSFGHVRNIGRRLIEAEAWPASNGSTIPQLEPKHIVYLLIALLADVEAKDAASVAKHYYNLPLTGDDKADGTATTAGEMIEQMFSSFLARTNLLFSKWAFKSRIEVYGTSTPAVCIITPCTDGTMTLTYSDADWPESTVRRSAIISGELLSVIAKDVSSHHVR